MARKPDPVMLVPRRVTVEWDDATTHTNGAFTREEALKLSLTRRHTAGYLVGEDAKAVRIAHTYDPEDDRFDDVTVIPAPWIRRRKRRKK